MNLLGATKIATAVSAAAAAPTTAFAFTFTPSLATSSSSASRCVSGKCHGRDRFGGVGGGGDSSTITIAAAPTRSTSLAAVASPPTIGAARGAAVRIWGPLQLLAAVPRALARQKLLALFSALLLCAAVRVGRLARQNALLRPDPASPAPLPPRAPSCPLIGNQVLVGSRGFGAGHFWHRMSRVLGHPRVWMYSFLGRGGVVMSGGPRLKAFLNLEFSDDGIYAGMKASKVLTADSLLSEDDKRTHSALRRLVGAAMTPAAVAASIPNLQAAAERQVTDMLSAPAGGSGTAPDAVTMEHICTDYTLDVAWKQLLGLELRAEQIPVFRKAVHTWIGGFTSLRIILNIGANGDPSIRAKDYLVQLIRDKITSLETNGPDDSTLSGMVFSRDEEGEDTEEGGRKLTTEQVVENALLLIMAGSETSASTLTNAMLGLGLHPHAWRKVVEEQRKLQCKIQNSDSHRHHGSNGRFPLTLKQLDQECPYLDAVVREAMRIKPIPSGVPRVTKKTLTIDDAYQIPRGWAVNWNVLLTHELDPVTFRKDGAHMTMETGFRPERWLDRDTRPTTDFMPMGAGPRYCLGATLAYAEMKVFLAVLARNVDFELVAAATGGAGGARPRTNDTSAREAVMWKRMSIIPKPANGVPVIVRPSTMMEGSHPTAQKTSEEEKVQPQTSPQAEEEEAHLTVAI